MEIPDPDRASKWLALFRKNGLEAGLLGLACAAFLIMQGCHVIPDPGAIVTGTVAISGLVSLTLAIALVVRKVHRWHEKRTWPKKRMAEVTRQLDLLSPEDTEIIGYCLAFKLQVIDTDATGSEARRLLSAGFIKPYTQPGQQVSFSNVPMIFPDEVWKVLIQHQHIFPSDRSQWEGKPKPWRRNWMAY